MSRIRKVARSIFVWSYGRGTIQYDIICALILAFIFFVPRGCFVPQKIDKTRPQSQNTLMTGPGVKADASPRQK
jgi:hypothetical protein